MLLKISLILTLIFIKISQLQILTPLLTTHLTDLKLLRIHSYNCQILMLI